MMSSSQNECPLYYSLSSLGSRTDRQYIHTLWTMKLSAAVRGVYEFFLPELVWKLKKITFVRPLYLVINTHPGL